MKKVLFLVFIFSLLLPLNAELSFRGQLDGGVQKISQWQQGTVEYIPQLTVRSQFHEQWEADWEMAARLSAQLGDNAENQAEWYRLQCRLSSDQAELRLGLQKINFGPAQLLRPLQWFDQVHPQEIAQTTSGVRALLLRYFWLNNANIWIWGLWNNHLKGNEQLATANNTVEYGGRFQYPMGSAEIGGSFHQRQVAWQEKKVPEYRWAADIRYDWLFEFWLETVAQKNASALPVRQWIQNTTWGADYTFPIGNGLYGLVEHQWMMEIEKKFHIQEHHQLSAMMISYPLTLFDTIQFFTYYSWESESFFPFLEGRRTYDNLVLQASVFHRDQNFVDANLQTASGWGGRIALVFYH